jgi:amino acid transporter
MKTYHKVGAWLSTIPLLLLPVSVLAVIKKPDTLLSDVGIATDGAVPEDFATTIGQLINVILSVLGIFFVIIVVYAGFLYLSAGGEEEKVKKAKKLISQAVIGIVIVLLAYSISTFVFTQLESVVDTPDSFTNVEFGKGAFSK